MTADENLSDNRSNYSKKLRKKEVTQSPPHHMTGPSMSDSSTPMAEAKAPTSSPSVASPKPAKLSAQDFIFGKLIGEGAFSTVFKARKTSDPTIVFAIKTCEKKLIQKEKKTTAIYRERDVMNVLNQHQNPYFINLHCTFQDVNYLYFVMDYAKCGELLPLIKSAGRFDLVTGQFYAGEILCALEHLHSLGIIHRDIKPENVLLTDKLHIKISDFGCAFIENPSHYNINNPHHDASSSSSYVDNDSEQGHRQRKKSFVGTAEYVSPEMLSNKAASKSSDLWAFGCIIYQMLMGKVPFKAQSDYLIFQKILALDFSYPEGFNQHAKDLINALLQLNPMDRLGVNDFTLPDGGIYSSIRNTQFFAPLTDRWDTLHQEVPPLIFPESTEDSEDEGENRVPGLDKQILARLYLNENLSDNRSPQLNILDVNGNEHKRLLEKQKMENPWHKFVEDNLILKMGLINKKKGLIPRSRMFLLTTGPHLYYVDPVNHVLKGQVPWSKELKTELRTFKKFLIHTPNRTYNLEDLLGDSQGWTDKIDEVKKGYFPTES